jgi:hypothetical protein
MIADTSESAKACICPGAQPIRSRIKLGLCFVRVAKPMNRVGKRNACIPFVLFGNKTS